MPSQTRDQKFKKSFDIFFDHLSSKLSEDNNYSNLLEYELKNIPFTCKQKVIGIAHYELRFPRKIVDYHIDIFIADEHGTIMPPGPVMKNQFIPTFSDFRRIFNDYFSEYYVRRADGLCMANVGIDNHSYEDKDGNVLVSGFDNQSILLNYDLKINLFVNYYKSELPFPVELTTKEQLQKRCCELERMNNELSKNVDSLTVLCQQNSNNYHNLRRIMRTERREIENKYRTMFEKMQGKIQNYYNEKAEKDDCPVCYEIIEPSKLKLPGCCHTICTSCAERCSKCPICREDY
jgi:hypothetical protein